MDSFTFEAPIVKSPMNLLLEAMRMKDELLVFTTEISDFAHVFRPTRPTWTGTTKSHSTAPC